MLGSNDALATRRLARHARACAFVINGSKTRDTGCKESNYELGRFEADRAPTRAGDAANPGGVAHLARALAAPIRT